MQLVHVEFINESSESACEKPVLTEISFRLTNTSDETILRVKNINLNNWVFELKDGFSLEISDSGAEMLKKQLGILSGHISVVKVALMQFPKGEVVDEFLINLIALTNYETNVSGNNDNLKDTDLQQRRWSKITQSLARNILDVLNRDLGKDKYSKCRFNIESELFQRYSETFLDKELLKILSEENDLLSTIETPLDDFDSIGLYKAVIEEALNIIANNVEYNMSEELICNTKLLTLREAGLSYADIDYLRELSLPNLNDITFEHAKKLSTYRFYVENIDSFMKIFKEYKNINDDRIIEDNAIISVDFGGLSFELNADKDLNGELRFEYYLCGKFKDSNGMIAWDIIEYTGITEDIDKLLNIDSLRKLKEFEEELFYKMLYYSLGKEYGWYYL